MTTETLLDIRNLSVSFPRRNGPDAWVIRDVSLQLHRAEIFGLIGESGSGKSTLGMTINGLLPRNARVEGEIRFEDVDVLSADAAQLRALRGNRIGMIFQDPISASNPTLPIGYQVVEPLLIHGRASKGDALRQSPSLLARVHISDPDRRARQYPFQMSGGMLQRSLTAMATSMQPDLLIADEPTTGLDVTIQAGVLALFREIRDQLQTTILLVTHDLGVIAETCDRVAVMYAGQIVELGPVDDIIRAPRHPYTQALLRATPDPDGDNAPLEPIPGMLPSPADHRPGCRFRDRCCQAFAACTQTPELLQVAPGHDVRCWMWKEAQA